MALATWLATCRWDLSPQKRLSPTPETSMIELVPEMGVSGCSVGMPGELRNGNRNFCIPIEIVAMVERDASSDGMRRERVEGVRCEIL